MRASRLLSILITLQLRGRVTARELAERFEVSKRTIFRDVDELSAAGVPIYAERGVNGGFALLDGYRTDLTSLDGTEREALFLAGLPTAAQDLGLSSAAASARLKLSAALDKGKVSGNSDIGERFYLDPSDWYRRSRQTPNLRTIADAVWSSRSVRLDYESWRGRGWRLVDPLGMVLKAGEWYLVAANRHGPAIYRIAMVHNAEILEQGFARPANFDLATVWSNLVDRFEDGLVSGTAHVRFGPASIDRIDCLGTTAAAAILSSEVDENGWRQAAIPMESAAATAANLLGFADTVEVVHPPELIREMRRYAEQLLSLYR
jgi:predicted DNA-binding transcriptional regulator YafY